MSFIASLVNVSKLSGDATLKKASVLTFTELSLNYQALQAKFTKIVSSNATGQSEIYYYQNFIPSAVSLTNILIVNLYYGIQGASFFQQVEIQLYETLAILLYLQNNYPGLSSSSYKNLIVDSNNLQALYDFLYNDIIG